MLLTVMALQVAALGVETPVLQVQELPRITLAEALDRAAQLDPDYVRATREIADAAWSRRAAITAFVLPAVNAQVSATRFSSEFFNIGTGQPAATIVDARVEASVNLFSGLSKFNELERAKAELAGAEARELEARFLTAVQTESDYYNVMAQRELTRVATERVRRATEQLAVARARVVSGAAVQTDSLQLLLELTEARVALLRQDAALKVSRYQLARRVGEPGPIDAAESDSLRAPALPLTEQQAILEAVGESPQASAARASEQAAEAQVRALRGAFFPSVDLFGQITSTDSKFFPTATTRSVAGISVSIPLWNNGQREIAISQATTVREVARALRADVELALRRDVVEAYQAYEAARATADLASQSVIVARENLRVQEQRYRTGATTIIDLITAQVSLSEADANLVQVRFATRLSLSGLEAILGRRLF